MNDINALWGGTLTDLRLDLNTRRATLRVTVSSGGGETIYEVVLSGLTDLRIERPDTNDWDYSEITCPKSITRLSPSGVRTAS